MRKGVSDGGHGGSADTAVANHIGSERTHHEDIGKYRDFNAYWSGQPAYCRVPDVYTAAAKDPDRPPVPRTSTFYV